MEKDTIITVTEEQKSISSSEDDEPAHPPHHHRPPIIDRLGTVSLCMFFGSAVVISNLVAFLAFLWFSNETNKVWHAIAVKDWMTRSVSFTSTALRFCTTTQTALSLSMLAALALEKYYVPHSEVAAVSMMRIGGSGLVGTLKDFIYPMTSRSPRFSLSLIMLVLTTILLLFTSTALQFTSTLLLSDIKPFSIPELPVNTTGIAYDYEWQGDGDDDGGVFVYDMLSTALTWGVNKPVVFPTFAEFTNSSSIISKDGVSDTGTTLRAFLPFEASTDRNNIRNYTGKAVVLDSRVICVSPDLTNLAYHTTSHEASYISGKLQPSSDLAEINGASDPIPFNCTLSSSTSDFKWLVPSLCELNNDAQYNYDTKKVAAGGLYSSLRKSRDDLSGAAYLIAYNSAVNMTGSEWSTYDIPASGDDYWSLPFTLCYAALDVANRNIKVFSDSSRAEITVNATFSVNYTDYDFSPLVTQMSPGKDVEERGILNMELAEKEVWAHKASSATGSDGPWPILDPYDGVTLGDGNYMTTYPAVFPYLVHTIHTRRWSAVGYAGLGDVSVELDTEEFNSEDYALRATGSQDWIGRLFNQFLPQSSGDGKSTARALQSVLTVLAGAHYYDRLSIYNKTTDITTTKFGTHQIARGPYGWNYNATLHARDYYYYPHFNIMWQHKVAPFFTLVLALLFVHELTVMCVFVWFMKSTRYSRLGDPWQAVAHVVAGNDSSKVVELSAKMGSNRAMAHKEMQDTGFEKVRVGLAPDADGVIVLRRYGV